MPALTQPFLRCVREPLIGGLLGVLAMTAAAGCAHKTSSLEQASDEVEVEVAAEVPPEQTPTELPSLPTTSLASAPLPAPLWSDLHWLPPEVVGINGTAPGTMPILARWVFSQPNADNEACRALQQGLAGGYGIEWEHPPQSFVFFGNASLRQVEDCATAFMSGMGGSARMDGQRLHLQMEGSDGTVSFAVRGDQLVVVVDDGRLGAVDELHPDRLHRRYDSLVELLSLVDRSKTVWSVSTRDMTQVPLGVSSRGYILYGEMNAARMEFRFVFGSEAEAQRASSATGPFLEEAEAFLGVPLRAEVEQDGSTLAAVVDLSALASLEPAKVQGLQQKLEQFAAGRANP